MKRFRQHMLDENPVVQAIARVAAKVLTKVDPGRVGAGGAAAQKSLSGNDSKDKKAKRPIPYPEYPRGLLAAPTSGRGMHTHDSRKGNRS